MEKIYALLSDFGINGEIVDVKTFKSGHINTTYYVKVRNGNQESEYVLQMINKNVFKKPIEVMENISGVTNFIAQKLESRGIDPQKKVLHFQPALTGEYFTLDEKGDYWRVYNFINNSVAFDSTDDPKLLEEIGKAFGEFQLLLADYPSKSLHDTIPNFHNTISRYMALKEKVLENPVHRRDGVADVISEYLKIEPIATHMTKLAREGKLPLRVTHNDTKCNNVLFDPETREYLCAIDLDTIMPGLLGHDFGDAMRFAGNTASEDETDLSKVRLDLDKYRAFTKGFLSKVAPTLTKAEKDTLSLGAITMTAECGARFLTDYLDGDHYFKTEYPEHNLDRAKCQLALAQNMLKQYSKMQSIVDDEYYEAMNQENSDN